MFTICMLHPDRRAEGRCAACRRDLCDDCLAFTLAGRLCARCAARARLRRLLRRGLAAAALLAACGGGLAFLISRDAPAAPAPVAKPAEKAYIRTIRSKLDAAPCDRSLAIRLAEALTHEDAHVDVIA